LWFSTTGLKGGLNAGNTFGKKSDTREALDVEKHKNHDFYAKKKENSMTLIPRKNLAIEFSDNSLPL
jgi:hypothetical protein